MYSLVYEGETCTYVNPVNDAMHWTNSMPIFFERAIHTRGFSDDINVIDIFQAHDALDAGYSQP